MTDSDVQSETEADQLGVECVIDGCDSRLVSLKDGWPSSTRDGPVCADCWDFNSEHGHFPDEESVRELLTDGGLQGPPGRRGTGTPEWEIEGGEGLPLAHDYRSRLNNGSQLWLFSCCGCGKRLIDPPGPPAGTCSCGGEWVCHRFEPKEYLAIRRFDDPRRVDDL